MCVTSYNEHFICHCYQKFSKKLIICFKKHLNVNVISYHYFDLIISITLDILKHMSKNGSACTCINRITLSNNLFLGSKHFLLILLINSDLNTGQILKRKKGNIKKKRVMIECD